MPLVFFVFDVMTYLFLCQLLLTKWTLRSRPVHTVNACFAWFLNDTAITVQKRKNQCEHSGIVLAYEQKSQAPGKASGIRFASHRVLVHPLHSRPEPQTWALYTWDLVRWHYDLETTKRKIEEICDYLESHSEWSTCTRISISYLQFTLYSSVQ